MHKYNIIYTCKIVIIVVADGMIPMLPQYTCNRHTVVG